jgi:hypothetical protein
VLVVNFVHLVLKALIFLLKILSYIFIEYKCEKIHGRARPFWFGRPSAHFRRSARSEAVALVTLAWNRTATVQMRIFSSFYCWDSQRYFGGGCFYYFSEEKIQYFSSYRRNILQLFQNFFLQPTDFWNFLVKFFSFQGGCIPQKKSKNKWGMPSPRIPPRVHHWGHTRKLSSLRKIFLENLC